MKAYTYSDVLIKPKYSEVESRTNVDLSTTIHNRKLNLPVISSNMKNITGPKMAAEINRHGGLGLLHRFCTVDENVKMFKELNIVHEPLANVGVSIGVKDEDKERFEKLYEAGARIFCIDVAHGHHVHVKNMLKWIRSEMLRWERYEISQVVLIAGNVATYDGYKELCEWGANAIKVGIGPGCFIPGTLVTTLTGDKNIENIRIGEYVLTHTGKYQKVLAVFTYDRDEDVITINNNITCTKNHEFYVVHKDDAEKITEDNVEQYARWISANELNDNYLLIELENTPE